MTPSLRRFSVLALGVALSACTDPFIVNVPQWPNGGNLAGTRALTAAEKDSLEGVYVVTQANGQFGDTLVLKWNGDYLAVYAGVHTAYMLMQAGATYDTGVGDSVIFLQGYWRYQSGENTGLAEMSTLLHRTAGVVLNGSFGSGNALPSSGMVFHFLRAISPAVLAKTFYLISHHGSGGAPELLPASENSVEIAKIIERYGANAIEIDTRPSKDSIPVLFHDNAMTPRLVQKGSLEGPVENYTFAQLERYVRLLRGEKIPTLQAFLDTVVVATNIEFVYVDLKPTSIDFLPTIVQVQQAALAKAATLNRNVHIYLALTSNDIFNKFIKLPNYQDIPTICELSFDQVQQANSQVWSPRFTQQIPTADIQTLHSQQKLAITWTVDVDSYLEQFIEAGELDGVLTDYLTLAAYYFYKQ